MLWSVVDMTAIKYPIKNHQGVFGYASTSNRHNGKPDICYYITTKIDGNKKTEKVGWLSEGYTPQLATELRAKRIRDARHNGEVQTSRDIRAEQRKVNRSLKEIKEHYFSSSKGSAIRGKKQDLNRWEHHLSHLEAKTIKELSQIDTERIKRNMKVKELAPATVDHALRLLRRIINHGIEHNLCPPLAFKIKRPKVDNTRTEFLSSDEASRLVETLDKWPRQDIARMVKLAWLTGLRRGELFGLKREHIDFQHSLLAIAGSKGGKSVTVPMSPQVRELLEQQINFLEDEQVRRVERYRNTTRLVPAWEDNGFIFPGFHGKQRMECTAIDRIKAAAGLPKHFRPFHGLRHHYAVLLASSGEYNLDQIGHLLTHKSSDITRRYAHYLPEAQRRSADRAAEILVEQATSTSGKEKKIVNVGP